MELMTAQKDKVDIMFGTGVSAAKDYANLLPLIKSAVANGIRGFDTAPSYGTEQVLGECLRTCVEEMGLERENIFIQTKVDAWQMMEGPDKVRTLVQSAMERMKLDYLDALLIHWPVPEYMEQTCQAMQEMKEEGWVRHLGVCNVRMRQLVNLPGDMMQIVQLERNPLRTCEREIDFCMNHQIAFQAYSPLCKMNPNIANNRDLQNITEKYHRNVGQIVMRWHLDTGVAPIFTTKKESRIQEYTKISDFHLTKAEVQIINGLNQDYKMYLESFACPGF